ncbi:MAG: MCP four helix bundle domain-containing protein, partial [Telluria sp.]
MRLLNLNIANRLRLGFGLLLVFIAVLAFVGYKSLDKLHQGTTDLARLAWPRARYTNIALDNVRGSMGRVGQLVAVDDPSVRDAAAQRLAANLDAADKAMQDLEPLLVSPTGKTLLAEARTHRDAYVALVGKVRALLAEGKKDEARDLAYGKAYDAMHAYAKSLRDQLNFQEGRFDELAKDADDTYATALRIIAGAAAAALLLSVGAAVVITRSVVR